MTIRRLERGEWGGFCVFATRWFLGKQVEIDIASLQVGFQLQARRLPLAGMAYDPDRDVLEVVAGESGEFDHLIRSPRELYIDETPLGTVYLQIVDSEGVQQILTLTDPLMLPPFDRLAGRS